MLRYPGNARKLAHQFAAQALLRSAKMVLENRHASGRDRRIWYVHRPEVPLRVESWNRMGFRSAVFEALNGAAEKGKDVISVTPKALKIR